MNWLFDTYFFKLFTDLFGDSSRIYQLSTLQCTSYTKHTHISLSIFVGAIKIFYNHTEIHSLIVYYSKSAQHKLVIADYYSCHKYIKAEHTHQGSSGFTHKGSSGFTIKITTK